MTKPRMLKCGDVNCPHEKVLFFSDWIRENCPAGSTGFMVTDIDFILINQSTFSIMILEVKTSGKKIQEWQRGVLNTLHKVISHGLPFVSPEMKYLGMHSITFTCTNFTNGTCFLDGVEIAETDLCTFLSMQNT